MWRGLCELAHNAAQPVDSAKLVDEDYEGTITDCLFPARIGNGDKVVNTELFSSHLILNQRRNGTLRFCVGGGNQGTSRRVPLGVGDANLHRHLE